MTCESVSSYRNPLTRQSSKLVDNFMYVRNKVSISMPTCLSKFFTHVAIEVIVAIEPANPARMRKTTFRRWIQMEKGWYTRMASTPWLMMVATAAMPKLRRLEKSSAKAPVTSPA